MSRSKPEYGAIKAGDVIKLPEGEWYVWDIRYAEASNDDRVFRAEGTYVDRQTDTLVLSLSRVNEVKE